MNALGQLPPELYGKIMSFVGCFETLALVPTVCRRWDEQHRDPMANVPIRLRGALDAKALRGSRRIEQVWALPGSQLTLGRTIFGHLRVLRIDDARSICALSLLAGVAPLLDDLYMARLPDCQWAGVARVFPRLSRLRVHSAFDAHDHEFVAGRSRPPPAPQHVLRPPHNSIRWARHTSAYRHNYVHDIIASPHTVGRIWATVCPKRSVCEVRTVCAGQIVATRYGIGCAVGVWRTIELDRLGGMIGCLGRQTSIICEDDSYVWSTHAGPPRPITATAAYIPTQDEQYHNFVGTDDWSRHYLHFNYMVRRIEVHGVDLRCAKLWLSGYCPFTTDAVPVEWPSDKVMVSATADADGVVRFDLCDNFSRIDHAYVSVQSGAPGQLHVVAHSGNTVTVVNGVAALAFMG
jgi:hypothetical protein